MNKKLLLIPITISMAISSCSTSNVPSFSVEQEDFYFVLTWGVGLDSSYDSRTGTLIKTKYVIERQPEEYIAIYQYPNINEIYEMAKSINVYSYADHYYPYDNYDEMTILLYKSHGSKYEGFVDELINMLDESSAELAQRYAQMFPNKRVNRQMLHWLTHVEINAYIHMMQHEKSREDAMRFIMPVMDYIIKGWLEYSLEDDI